MQIYAINGSPRKKWNTAQALESALAGAAESADNVLTEMINLYDYNYKGCVECFACKRIGGPSYGKCAVKDDIHSLLRNVLMADAIIFGSPIYFSEITGMMRCFLERLVFPVMVYDKNHSSIAPRKVHTGFIYTMNAPANVMDTYHYRERLGVMENFCGNIFQHKPRILYINDTLQFPDYSKYENSLFSPEEKQRHHDLQFPIDLKSARELGAALAADAAGEPEFIPREN